MTFEDAFATRPLIAIVRDLSPDEGEPVGAALKLFPAESSSPAALRAVRAVLPVGGISPENMTAWTEAGAAGFGIGSALYKPGLTTAEVAERARAFIVMSKK